MGSNERRRRSNVREIGILIAIIAVLVIAGMAFSHHLASRSLASVRFESDGALSNVVKLEVADSHPKRQLGLMYRKEMGRDHGMLFIFPDEAVQKFWMKDTYLSLDMIFVNSSWEVVGVLENVPPLNTESRYVDAASRYVIELVAGRAKEIGIRKGTRVRVEGEIPRS